MFYLPGEAGSPGSHRWFAYSPSSCCSSLQSVCLSIFTSIPSTLLINNDGGDESSTQGHFELLGWHRNGCWPAWVSIRSLYSILPPSCCTTNMSPGVQTQCEPSTCQSLAHVDYATRRGEIISTNPLISFLLVCVKCHKRRAEILVRDRKKINIVFRWMLDGRVV